MILKTFAYYRRFHGGKKSKENKIVKLFLDSVHRRKILLTFMHQFSVYLLIIT